MSKISVTLTAAHMGEYRDACSGILDPFAADAAWQEAVKRAA